MTQIYYIAKFFQMIYTTIQKFGVIKVLKKKKNSFIQQGH